MMEEKQPSAFKTSIVPGLLMGLALIVYSLIMYVLDIDRESKIMWLSYLVMIGMLYWAMTSYRDKYLGGFATYGQVFKAGFFTVLIASVITGIFTYIYVTAIDLALLDEIMLQAEEDILANTPDISDEDLEFALSMTENFTSPPMITVFATVGNLIFGTIFSLIISIFVKRENTNLA